MLYSGLFPAGAALFYQLVNIIMYDLLDLIDEPEAHHGRVFPGHLCDLLRDIRDRVLGELERGAGNLPDGIFQFFVEGRAHNHVPCVLGQGWKKFLFIIYCSDYIIMIMDQIS